MIRIALAAANHFGGVTKKVGLAATVAIGLAACTPAQVEKAQSYQQQLAAACQVAMMVAPLSPQIAPWIVGGCGTADAIAGLALDGNSLNWLNGLIRDARAS